MFIDINLIMKFTIPNIWFVVFLAILTGYLTFLTTKGSLTNNTYKYLYKKITKRGYLVIIVLFLILAVMILQEFNSQYVNDNKDHLLRKEKQEQSKKISEGVKKGIDSANAKLFGDISKSFAKQGLKIDSLNNEISRLNNITTVNNYLNDSDPVLGVYSNKGIYRTGNQYRLQLRSEKATSTNFDIKFLILYQPKNSPYKILEKNNLLSKGSKITHIADIPLLKTSDSITDFYLYLKGSYSNLSKSKTYIIDDVYYYDYEDYQTYMMPDWRKEKFLQILKKL